MSQPTRFSIKDIGNTLQLRDESDPGLKVTNWFRQGLNIVDIYPASFKLNLTAKNINFGIYNTGQDTDLGFFDPTKKYQDKCEAYGLGRDTTALRLWITGESTFQEEFGNQYETNLIESGINGIVNKISPLLSTVKSAVSGSGGKLGAALKPVITKTGDNVISAISSPLGNSQAVEVVTKTLRNFSHLVINKTLSFSYLSIPKTYTGSSYTPALSFNVRLISPYGARKAIEEFIVKPLTYILLLSTPTTTDGVTYGGSTYVTVKAYGISDIPLAIIDNVSIRRGGNDVAYNKFRQPLSIDINISIKPASDGFAAFMQSDGDGKFTVNDHEINGTGISGVSNGVNGIATSTTNDAAAIINIQDSGKRGSSMTTVGSILESLKPMPVFDNKPGQIVTGNTLHNTPQSSGGSVHNDKVKVRESAFAKASKLSPPSFSKSQPITRSRVRAEREAHARRLVGSVIPTVNIG